MSVDSSDKDHPKNIIWPQLYEKALAKLRGGYEHLNGGDPGDAIATLTGQPVTNTKPANAAGLRTALTTSKTPGTIATADSDIAAQMPPSIDGRYNVTLNQNGTATVTDTESPGSQWTIVLGHAYSVLGASATGIILRNPWGSGGPQDNGEFELPDAVFNAVFLQNHVGTVPPV